MGSHWLHTLLFIACGLDLVQKAINMCDEAKVSWRGRSLIVELMTKLAAVLFMDEVMFSYKTHRSFF